MTEPKEFHGKHRGQLVRMILKERSHAQARERVKVTGCRDCPFAGPDPCAGDPRDAGHGGPCKHPSREKRVLINPYCAVIPKDCPLPDASVVVVAGAQREGEVTT